MMYAYVLGLGIAILCETAIGSMDTIDFKASTLVRNSLLWPVSLCKRASAAL